MAHIFGDRGSRVRFSLPVILLGIAFPFIPPNILSGNRTVVGVSLVILGALIAFIQDSNRIHGAPSAGRVIVLVTAASLWVSTRAADPGSTLQGAAVGLVVLACASIILSNGERARQAGRLFVLAVLVLCASAAITLVLWRGLGIAPVLVTQFDIGTLAGNLYLPVTSSVGVQSAWGIQFPRFAGLGREPGWMSMYAALAWFIWPIVGKPRVVGRLLLAFGVLAPLSTAGFGIFVVAVAYEIFLVPRPASNVLVAYLRQLVGVAALAFAIWIAYFAPVFGLAAKSTQNTDSLVGRGESTQAGLQALLQLSLGYPSDVPAANLNLVAAASENGWPFFALILLALVTPLIGLRGRQAAFPPLLTIALFLLAAQPPGGSFGAFIMIILSCAVAAPREDAHVDLLGRNLIPDRLRRPQGDVVTRE